MAFLNGRIKGYLEKGEDLPEAIDKETAQVDAKIVKIMQATWRKDLIARAYDLGSMLNLRKSLHIARKVAHNDKQTRLSEKLVDLMEIFENRESKTELQRQTLQQQQQYQQQQITELHEQLQQLQKNYETILDANEKLANSKNTTKENKTQPNGQPAQQSNGKKLTSLSRPHANGNGVHKKTEETDHSEEDGLANYVSPDNSEDEEEEEEGEDKVKDGKGVEQNGLNGKTKENDEEKDGKDDVQENDNQEGNEDEKDKTELPKANGKGKKKNTTTKSPLKLANDTTLDPMKTRNPFAVKKPTIAPTNGNVFDSLGKLKQDEEEEQKQRKRKFDEEEEKPKQSGKKRKQADKSATSPATKKKGKAKAN